jgi:microcystin-dependent protein
VEPFIGEIRLFGFNFAPLGWALCDGSLLPISQNTALFSLLGTTYGGDGRSTFALPDLRGRVPVSMGTGPGLSTYDIGELGGSENVTLIASQVPAHNHNIQASDAPASEPKPGGGVLARTNSSTYAAGTDGTTLSANAISSSGGSQPHPNLQPFLAVNFCIALQGIFPSRN